MQVQWLLLVLLLLPLCCCMHRSHPLEDRQKLLGAEVNKGPLLLLLLLVLLLLLSLLLLLRPRGEFASEGIVSQAQSAR